MAKPFAAGDQVEWRYFGGKEWTGGIIGSIDHELGIMSVNQGHFYGIEASRATHTVRRINGRWLAFRAGHDDYIDRIRHVKT